MREFKILTVVVFFTALIYWGVEPFAHSQMHPHVAPADFAFKDLGTNTKVGNAKVGAETFLSAGCTGCHSLTVASMPAPMDAAAALASFGVVPPDLSTAGLIYDKNYLSALIKDPTKALKVQHKFNEEKPHPMIAFYGLGGDIDQEIADIVAYLQSVAPQKLSDKEVFANACQRCHDMKYDKVFSATDKKTLTAYMGTLPPDLSIIIRAKSYEYLEIFINDPQKNLEGTSMPRVGLTQKAQEQVVGYMEKVGDRKKAEREDLGYKLIGFMAIFTFLAYLWKVKVWRDVH